jgi:hypothetical protein
LEFNDIKLIRTHVAAKTKERGSANPWIFSKEIVAAKKLLRQHSIQAQTATSEFLIPIAVTPYLGSGERAMFTLVVSDRRGAANLADAELRIQSEGQQTRACLLSVSLISRTIALLDETGQVDQFGKIDSSLPLQNSYCKIWDRSIATASQDSVQVRVALEFSPSFSGSHNLYVQIADHEHKRSPQQWLGSWYVPKP